MIEVREARYFLAVAQTLHFGRAAELLGMSQPPLSQAILQLERRLGARLLDRTNRKVALTGTGRAFAVECRDLVAAAEHAQQVATQAEAGLVGTLRVGVVTSALGEPLRTTIETFRQSRPQVELRVVEVDSRVAAEHLLRRDVDVAVVRLSTPVRGLRTQSWRRDCFVIALPGDHPVAAEPAGPVDLARFADEPWVWLTRDTSPDYYDQLVAACRAAGFSPDARHLATTITTQLAMVASGLGVALVPNVAARAIPAPATFRALTHRADLVELSLVTRDSAHEPLVREFLRIASWRPGGDGDRPRGVDEPDDQGEEERGDRDDEQGGGQSAGGAGQGEDRKWTDELADEHRGGPDSGAAAALLEAQAAQRPGEQGGQHEAVAEAGDDGAEHRDRH
jgi:DNA-binding transcriptional LysR family regulator